MKRLSLLFVFFIVSSLFWNATCQIYCESRAIGSSQWENIKNVSFAGIFNDTSYEVGGYSDYTSQVANVYRGRTNSLYVNVKADGNDFLYVFIDWNQDGVWDNNDPEAIEIYTVRAKINRGHIGPHKLNIQVPEGASLGSTRMRVTLGYDMEAPLSCGDFEHGEVEDYTVLVRGTNL